MNELLDELNRVRGVGGSLLLSADGLTIAASLRNDIDEDDFAANVSKTIEQSESLCEKAQLRRPGMLHFQGQENGVLVLRAGKGFLALIADPNANLALLQLEAKPYIESIAQQLTLS